MHHVIQPTKRPDEHNQTSATKRRMRSNCQKVRRITREQKKGAIKQRQTRADVGAPASVVAPTGTQFWVPSPHGSGAIRGLWLPPRIMTRADPSAHGTMRNFCDARFMDNYIVRNAKKPICLFVKCRTPFGAKRQELTLPRTSSIPGLYIPQKMY